MIKYISGDILQSKDEYIAQGVAVGSQEGLGTGLAFKLSSQFLKSKNSLRGTHETPSFRLAMCL